MYFCTPPSVRNFPGEFFRYLSPSDVSHRPLKLRYLHSRSTFASVMALIVNAAGIVEVAGVVVLLSVVQEAIYIFHDI